MQQCILALLAVSLAAGCTTTRTFSSISSASAAQIPPGKTAVIEFVDGSSEKVDVRSYGATAVDVVSSDRTVKSIDYGDIRTIYVEQLDESRTARAVIAGAVVVGLLALMGYGLQGAAGLPAGP